MNLRHLCSAPSVHVYFDSWHNWLYLEWEGVLTLPVLQQASLEIARCFVANAYPRILNNNTQVSHVEHDVAPWLAQHFLPYLSLAGVQQLAWVYGPSQRALQMARQVLRFLDTQVHVSLFADTEDAVSWLQQVRPSYVSGCELLPRIVPRDTKLKRLLRTFELEVAATRAPLPAASAGVGQPLLSA